jgi:hypothetical protein
MSQEPEYIGNESIQESLEQLIIELIRAGLVSVNCESSVIQSFEPQAA